MDPIEIGISLEIWRWREREKKKEASQKGNKSSRKTLHTILTMYQTKLQDETEAQIMMGQWRLRSHIDQDTGPLNLNLISGH